jgi:phosphatidylserine decarboxylase
MRIDPEGLILSLALIGCAAALWLVAAGTGWAAPKWLAAVVCAAGLFSLMFFRDPERSVPSGEGIAVSAADGVVVDAGPYKGGNPGEAGTVRIAVFMNVFNVHVNRSPVNGVVTGTAHHDGKKLSVLNKRAEYENEHGDTEIDTPFGRVRVRQIAGLIARRVVTRVQAGDTLRTGDRIGLIRFGSRVDVFLPEGYEPAVRLGEKVRAGETVIARRTR